MEKRVFRFLSASLLIRSGSPGLRQWGDCGGEYVRSKKGLDLGEEFHRKKKGVFLLRSPSSLRGARMGQRIGKESGP